MTKTVESKRDELMRKLSEIGYSFKRVYPGKGVDEYCRIIDHSGEDIRVHIGYDSVILDADNAMSLEFPFDFLDVYEYDGCTVGLGDR